MLCPEEGTIFLIPRGNNVLKGVISYYLSNVFNKTKINKYCEKENSWKMSVGEFHLGTDEISSLVAREKYMNNCVMF